MTSSYESTLGKALDIMSHGYRIPYAIKRDLIDDQGYTPEEVMALEAFYLTKFNQGQV